MNNKKSFVILVIAAIMMIFVSFNVINVFAQNIGVFLDGNSVMLTDAQGRIVEPFIQNGTTYVPLRGVSEVLGCQVEWDEENRTVKVYKDISPDGKVFRNSSDDVNVYIDNERIELKDANGTVVKPITLNDTNYIPLRGISEALGCQVEWDGNLQRVSIYKETVSPNGATLDFVRPYDKSGLGIGFCYESEGDYLEIDGRNYTNSINAGSWEGTAFFDLNGKYSTMTFVAGFTGYNEKEREIDFIVDGNLIKTITIAPHSPAAEYQVDLNKGLKLKIILDDYLGMGNIIFR